MINACVSHEMRNPLNSVVAQNIEKKFLYAELEQLAQKLQQDPDFLPEFLVKHEEIMEKLKKGLKVQQSSSNVLTYIV